MVNPDCLLREQKEASRATSRVQLIVNPTAGGGTARQAVLSIERMLRKRGVAFDLVCTKRPWHAAELTRQAVSGDGTSNEVLNGLMQAKQVAAGTAAMGVLCVGRGRASLRGRLAC